MESYTGSITSGMVSGYFVLLPCLKDIPEFNANIVEPDQMPCSAVSDLGLQWLPMSLLWDSRHK